MLCHARPSITAHKVTSSMKSKFCPSTNSTQYYLCVNQACYNCTDDEAIPDFNHIGNTPGDAVCKDMFNKAPQDPYYEINFQRDFEIHIDKQDLETKKKSRRKFQNLTSEDMLGWIK